MNQTISSREAIVRTMGVSIKTLTVSNKQVTMGLFRQLKCEAVVDVATAGLNGTPWGSVNYYWGDCKPDHLHVVWQKGDELRRACCWQTRIPSRVVGNVQDYVTDGGARRRLDYAYQREMTERFGIWRDEYQKASGKRFWSQPKWENGKPGWNCLTRFELDTATADWSLYDQAHPVITPDEYYQRHVRWALSEQILRELRERLCGDLKPSAELLAPELMALVWDNQPEEHQRLEDLWAKRWQELCSLPQLFIAV